MGENKEGLEMKMNAIGLLEFGGPDVLKTIEVDRPQPREDQVLIRIQGVSVNFADVQTRKGAFHGGGAAFPLIPGPIPTGGWSVWPPTDGWWFSAMPPGLMPKLTQDSSTAAAGQCWAIAPLLQGRPGLSGSWTRRRK